eukprot:4798-Heterococcus_DN1.PRE.1
MYTQTRSSSSVQYSVTCATLRLVAMAMSECCSSSFGASCEKEHVRIDHREAFAYARSLPMLDYQRKLCSCRVNYYDK